MATINLGAIKFNWKGAYNSSTSYAVDDVVSSGGNSYVCIQAHSTAQAVGNATAYWNIMSSAGTNGTNGTDLTSTLSTRGDIVYKGASALERLPKGTAGYYLKQGANDPEWAEVAGGGKFGQIVTNESSTATSSVTSVGTYSDFTNQPTITITPTATSSKVLIEWNFILSGGGSSSGFGVAITDSSNNIMTSTGIYGSGTNGITMRYLHTANTTSAITYKLRGVVNSSGGHHLYLYANPSNPHIKVFCSATEILA